MGDQAMYEVPGELLREPREGARAALGWCAYCVAGACGHPPCRGVGRGTPLPALTAVGGTSVCGDCAGQALDALGLRSPVSRRGRHGEPGAPRAGEGPQP